MADEHNMRRVTAIRNGTVIDHIPSGQSLKVLELLNIARDTSVPVSLVNSRSSTLTMSFEPIFFEGTFMTKDTGTEVSRAMLRSSRTFSDCPDGM